VNLYSATIATKSLLVQHFHAGFSERQIFYSADSKKTLIVPYDAKLKILRTTTKKRLTKKNQLPKVRAELMKVEPNGN